MQIRYIGILKNEKPGVELCVARNLEGLGWFTKKPVSEFMSLFAVDSAEKTQPGVKHKFTPPKEFQDNYMIHAYGHPTQGICGVVIADNNYDERPLTTLLRQITYEFVSKYPRSAYANITDQFLKDAPNRLPYPELEEYLKKWQNPEEADAIVKIQKDLDDTTVAIRQTMESVLERGEKIDNLVAKSDGLSAQSKMFYTQAKKQNSCCVVM